MSGLLPCPSCRNGLQVDASMAGAWVACPYCHQQFQIPAWPSPSPFQALPASTPLHASHSSYSRGEPPSSTGVVCGLVGSAILFIGVFMPIFSAPIIGDINYFLNGKGDGVLILALALLSAALSFLRIFDGLWPTSLAALSLISFSGTSYFVRMSEMKKRMASDLDDNPFQGIAVAFAEGVQLQWGWAVLVIGALTVLAAAIIADRTERQRRDMSRAIVGIGAALVCSASVVAFTLQLGGQPTLIGYLLSLDTPLTPKGAARQGKPAPEQAKYDAKLGQPFILGNLRIVPRSLQVMALPIDGPGKGNVQKRCLILTFSAQNISEDQVFQPLCQMAGTDNFKNNLKEPSGYVALSRESDLLKQLNPGESGKVVICVELKNEKAHTFDMTVTQKTGSRVTDHGIWTINALNVDPLLRN